MAIGLLSFRTGSRASGWDWFVGTQLKECTGASLPDVNAFGRVAVAAADEARRVEPSWDIASSRRPLYMIPDRELNAMAVRAPDSEWPAIRDELHWRIDPLWEGPSGNNELTAEQPAA